jgi:hypothetical protein
MAEIVLRLSCAETRHDRLDTLKTHARRLKHEVAEAKRQCIKNAKRPTSLMRHVKYVLTCSDWCFLVALAVLIAAWSTGVL